MVTGTVSPITRSGAADVATVGNLLSHSPCVVQHLDPRAERSQDSHLETNVCSSYGCKEKLENAGLSDPLSLDTTWAVKGEPTIIFHLTYVFVRLVYGFCEA